jgi:hypothetical protein
MSRQRPPAIVAELGRPETPEEYAARKAEASRLRRSRQTLTNLWLSILASLGVLLALVLVVPRGDAKFAPHVDYVAVAKEAQGGVDVPLAVPKLGAGWRSNSAELRDGADGVRSWYVGLLTPHDDYLGFSQGIDANESWLAAVLNDSRADSTERIGGLEWTVYDNRDTGAKGNVEYALATTTAEGVYAVDGTADPAAAKTLAAAVAASAGASS